MSDTIFQETRPWEQPFWKPARGKGAVLFYFVLIHVLAIIGLILFPLPSPKVFGLALLLAALGGLGITVCYHRLLAHRTFKLNKFVEHFLIFWAMFNSGGSPASWVAYHRHHHSHTDMPEDISSPKQGGFWWAHLRWLYQSAPADEQKWCPELSRGIV
jgi:fatty-acid desaturase